jgi:hypothetical protein
MNVWKFDEEEGSQLSKSVAQVCACCVIKLRKCVLVAKNVDIFLLGVFIVGKAVTNYGDVLPQVKNTCGSEDAQPAVNILL